MLKVPVPDLTVLEGQDQLTLYQWNMRIARHYFCRVCGIYVFHNKRAAPDHFGVNVRCLTDLTLSDAPVRPTDGKDMSVNRNQPSQDIWPGPRL